ncbi:MAG TPA: efflux RND transporter periplasmic adaptor subunit [Candidatus Xenobia bacterium]|nr:efflux RND transporter periplasmic adaptor subunit [Candidatus Xenobia bacterium]
MNLSWGLAMALLLAALAAAGCGGDSGSPAASRAASAPPTPTPEKPAAASSVQEILSVLSVEHEVDVLPQADGVVVEILHDEGSAVDKGAVLARLDDRETRARLEKARANLAARENQVKYNEAELKANDAAYRRAQEMHKLGLWSDAQLEEAEFKASGSKYDLAASQALLESAQAEVKELEAQLEKTRIRAPFAGLVARRYIRVGQTVLKDDKDDRCFRVSALRPLQVRFLVSEMTGRRPRPGELVNVVPASDSQRVYPARITRVSPTVDPGSGSYDVTAVLVGSTLSELRPGMSVKVLWEAPPR